jgi:hypothetical protein
MPVTCWWSFRRIGGAIHRHHRPHKWIGRGAAHAGHHHTGTATVVVKILVCAAIGAGGGAIGWSSSWGGAGAAGSVPPGFYGETGPEWWSAGLAPSLFAPSQIGPEAFAVMPISASSLLSIENGANAAFGETTKRSEERPTETALFVPPKTLGVPQQPQLTTPQQTENVSEPPSSLCALLTAMGLITIARVICRQ